ncbi:MAG: antibiotic biosynthesis monooxygenase [Firmicutes bacterium]|nr:antibiotic biosynthesis monooxygenase [Bacillota bacterium]
MTYFLVTYSMPTKEDRDGFYNEAKARGIVDKSRAEDGCFRYDYFNPVESDTTLFLLEQWESREHQKAHCQTEHFAELGTLKEKYNATTQIDIVDAC